MENLSNISVIRDVLSRHGFSFSKGLGQNFLINPTVCPRMAEMGNAQPGWGMIEIGAGVGVLTAELAQRADKVVCIEIDSRLLPILDETLAEYDNIKIVNQDVLKVDLHKLIAEEFPNMPVAVCANLPYYITSPIIMNLLESRLPISSLTVMVQKEAAQRICAMPGSREVGAVSIAVRYYCEPKVLFQVSRGSFMPAPDVDSTVIRLDIRKQPAVDVKREEDFFRVVKAAFSQRRKTLSNTLSSGLSMNKTQIAELLECAGVASNLRAEQLSMQQFADIANALNP
ncbi:MAG: 16S rRNA (adenine(1518)-N(6)/adenine(1519)-N(6))-dimethyltransferase RsmA [Negativibacillus massiliensis]|uniref:16S rRNA (adenine(1518)-N(6)/adenine(1519)-N(6))- dimethyltransferase RsmA n=1 Tax=Negativibacillus massiliensis TaxID=1871035 RepID=UPI0023F05E2D|nr:16S rRNA (adenine(1518)-N(6)/adenine(1519)-N(6))-dimethyltransferase RsmA [Negativibacillus massiliensis]MCI6348841.1 16S rRNA (adenine(1518)-N(6)/adenine(1519)-N(6))-dimethyltransferase RsmA [Negativibacillus massiliensis]MDY4046488.1 16S rRNA (adenine(1518)-N(6)/adenine(1519)-N(6))-dimethyltransferase RsmA [Negativibacillus massiliensis]